ncbi:MAG: transglutaminase domain-containing protein [Candidatus Micrarchaeota archaeon]|nr:transglutaminase domain-containing protein [Candidatus Micrarchaeota archaeon]
MLNRKTFIIIVLLIFYIRSGLEANQLEEMNLTVLQKGTVTAVGGELKYVSMNVSVPPNTDYQSVASNKPARTVDGRNSIAIIESTNPSNPFSYSISSSVNVKTRRTFSLPQSYQLGYSERLYMQPSTRVQSDDADIKSLARNITANSSDDFERIAKIGIWVNSQMSYDMSIAGLLKDSKWILSNKKGVCTEYSTLFVTLARAAGIPARFVTGFAYDENKSEWSGHSWAEVYIGKWVPVDATWNEIGYLDARHLEISDTVDSEQFNSVYAEMSRDARLEWSRSDVTRTSDIGADITINGMKETEKNSDYQLYSAADTLGFGMKTLVFSTVTSNDYRVATLTLTPCTNDILSVEDGDKEVILRPGETKVVSWVVKSNQQLSSNFIYTCPLVINSDYLSPQEVEIKATSDAQSINFNAFLERSEIKLGQNETVNVDVGVARKYGGKLYVSGEDYVDAQPMTRSGRYSFTLQPKKLGLNKVYITTSSGGIKELQFKVSGSGGIAFDVDAPQLVALESEAKIHVNLTTNETASSVRITATAGSSEQATQITFTGNKSVDFSLNITDIQTQNITVTVESGSYLSEVVKPITVYRIPQPNVTNVYFSIENGYVRADIIFSGLEDINDTMVTIDNQPVSVMKNGSVSALLTGGIHVVKVNYTDVTGAAHVYTRLINIPPISDIKANQSANQSKVDIDISAYTKEIFAFLPAGVCCSSLLFLILLVIVLRKFERR